MKKKAYMRPAIMAEKFVAETFCAACETITQVIIETFTAGQGYFATDLDKDGIFDVNEQGKGNIQQINPQSTDLVMSGDEYQNKYLVERVQGFYWPDYGGGKDDWEKGYTPVYGYAQTGNNISGSGAFAIETKTIEKIYKNQS